MSTEVLEFEELRKAVATQAKAAQLSVGVPFKFPNAPWKQPATGVWVEYALITGKTKVLEPGGIGGKQLELTACVLQFDCYCPENVGDGDITRAADRIKRLFDVKQTIVPQVGNYRTDAFTVENKNALAPRGFYRLCAWGNLFYYHRNPNA